MRIVPAELEHFDGIDLKEADPELKVFASRFFSFTLLDDNDKVVALAGCVRLFSGVGWAWFVPTELVQQHKFAVARFVRNMLVVGVRQHVLHRLETKAIKSNHDHCRFLEWLGFESEGTARQYGHEKQDYEHYSMIF